MEGRARFVAVAVIVMAVLLAVASFVGARHHVTPFGRPLGEDFAVFYDSGRILNAGQTSRLYDTAYQDDLYHHLFPTLPASSTLPYVYPPVFAEALRPLAELSYEDAFAVWLVIGMALYLVGVRLFTAGLGLRGRERVTVEVLAVSFEPFIFETWLGGQTGSIAFAALGAAFFLDTRDRPVATGVALGLCAYKPTLLLYAVPLLVLSRSWRAVGGMVLSSGAVAAASVILTGWGANRAYVKALVRHTSYARGAGAVSLRLWKFVDLNSFLRLLFGDSVAITVAVVIAVIGCVAAVSLRGRRSRDAEVRAVVWAAGITATTVVNFYVGVYDSLVVAGALIIVFATRPRGAPQRWLPWLAAAVYVTPFVSQLTARALHLQLLTAVLVVLLAYELRILGAARGDRGAGPGPAQVPAAECSRPAVLAEGP